MSCLHLTHTPLHAHHTQTNQEPPAPPPRISILRRHDSNVCAIRSSPPTSPPQTPPPPSPPPSPTASDLALLSEPAPSPAEEHQPQPQGGADEEPEPAHLPSLPRRRRSNSLVVVEALAAAAKAAAEASGQPPPPSSPREDAHEAPTRVKRIRSTLHHLAASPSTLGRRDSSSPSREHHEQHRSSTAGAAGATAEAPGDADAGAANHASSSGGRSSLLAPASQAPASGPSGSATAAAAAAAGCGAWKGKEGGHGLLQRKDPPPDLPCAALRGRIRPFLVLEEVGALLDQIDLACSKDRRSGSFILVLTSFTCYRT